MVYTHVLGVHVSVWVVWQMQEYNCMFVLPFKFLSCFRLYVFVEWSVVVSPGAFFSLFAYMCVCIVSVTVGLGPITCL